MYLGMRFGKGTRLQVPRWVPGSTRAIHLPTGEGLSSPYPGDSPLPCIPCSSDEKAEGREARSRLVKKPKHLEKAVQVLSSGPGL